MTNAEFLVFTFSSNFGRLVYEYRTATKINNYDLYEVQSLDLNPFGDYIRQYQSIHYRNSSTQDNELNFHKNDLILVPKNRIRSLMPKRHFGILKEKSKDELKHFLRSSVKKLFAVSDNFPPILID